MCVTSALQMDGKFKIGASGIQWHSKTCVRRLD